MKYAKKIFLEILLLKNKHTIMPTKKYGKYLNINLSESNMKQHVNDKMKTTKNDLLLEIKYGNINANNI